MYHQGLWYLELIQTNKNLNIIRNSGITNKNLYRNKMHPINMTHTKSIKNMKNMF